jgi:ABC-type nitrate/sulfonate/bicarbonate transport system substrate-binding protein
VGLVLAAGSLGAEPPFAEKLGDVKIGDVADAPAYDLPFFTWGGDVATFLANGGDKETRAGTIFEKHGLKFNLVNGDIFVTQVKHYLEGKTPFLRGTVSQLGQASEVLGKDPRTRPVVFLQLTWSVGDYLVGREAVRTPAQLKGKKVCLQWGGPHVGMLDDILRTAELTWSDIRIVWVDDVTGPKGPAEKFRNDASIDACFCITPDMEGLTGGWDQIGTGAETTVKGARVVVSTRNFSRSIADVYACRKDYYDKHKYAIQKLVAAYLKASENLVELHQNRLKREKRSKLLDATYTALLKTTQEIYGKETIPDLDAAHGLVADAVFAGLAGNHSFFKDDSALSNFRRRSKSAVDMAVAQGYAGERFDLTAADLDYEMIKKLGDLHSEITSTGNGAVQVPFIFWGGDVVTFHANGGLETAPNSYYARQDLKIKLVPGDNFDEQVKNYLDNRSPFLRGTLSMLGQASEQLTAAPDTTPVVFLQLTWSAGDHLVGRKEFHNLNDLRGKKIALQKGGPHVGMLNDILRTTRLEWRDIKVLWTDDVSGDKGPAAALRKDSTVDGCFAISPEMFALTSAPASGGIDSTGDGTKDSIKGVHVVVSSQHMARSIADVYACRRDFYQEHREWVDRFVAGYLKGSEELVDLKLKAEAKDKVAEAAYQKTLKLAQSIWSKDPAFKDAVANLDDVSGLISDAVYVGLPGNRAFFTQRGNLSGFDFKQKQACALPADPVKEPIKETPKLFQAAELEYPAISKLGDLRGRPPTRPRIDPIGKVPTEPEAEIFRFRVAFAKDTPTFSEADYGSDFQRALEVASLFANTVVDIRGHADPARTVQRFLRAATDAGIVRKEGDSYTIVAEKKPLDPTNDTKKILEIIASEPEDNLRYKDRGGEGSVRGAVRFLQELSQQRAESVQGAVVRYAEARRLVLDKSQIYAEGVGLTKPEHGFPVTEEERARNRRVEFIIVKVPADKVNAKEFE